MKPKPEIYKLYRHLFASEEGKKVLRHMLEELFFIRRNGTFITGLPQQKDGSIDIENTIFEGALRSYAGRLLNHLDHELRREILNHDE